MNSLVSSEISLQALLSMAPNAAKENLASYLLDVTIEITHLESERRSEVEAEFLNLSPLQMGFDSLTMVTFQGRVKEDLSVFLSLDRLIGDINGAHVVSMVYDQILFNRLTLKQGEGALDAGDTEEFTL